MKNWKQNVVIGMLAIIALSFGFVGCPDGNDNTHTHDWKWVVTTPTTTEAEGVETETCSICGKTRGTRLIPQLTHTHEWGNWLVTTPATYLTTGVETRTCSLDEAHTETRIIPSGFSTDINSQTGGNSAANPIQVTPQIDLVDSGWQNLLEAIAEAGKYISLDLSDSTGMTEFNPGTANTGEKMIVSLILPDTVTGIADGDWSNPTFEYFSVLQEITGLNVIDIGDLTFYQRMSLTKVDFPKATSIGNNTFYICSNLTEVNLPAVTSIGNGALMWCTSIKELNFPLLSSIDGQRAFSGCTSLTKISFPASTNISNYYYSPFEGCNSLINFNIIGTGTLSVMENGKALVLNNTELVDYPSASGNITMNTITSIFGMAFTNCTNLIEVNFPAVTSIDSYAFSYCQNLTKASFPEVERISSSAFDHCASLTEISFPATANIRSRAFAGCSSLTVFNLIGTGTLSVMENGKALVLNNTELLAYPSASGSIVMNTITYIYDMAFTECTSLIEVSIPAVSVIETYAFRNCTNLNKVTLGSITENDFWTYAFDGTGNLRDVYFGVGGGPGTYTTANPGNNAIWTKQ
jgi:hypothetical protein